MFALSVKDKKTSLGTSEYTGGEDVRLLTRFEQCLPAGRQERTSAKPEAHQSLADG